LENNASGGVGRKNALISKVFVILASETKINAVIDLDEINRDIIDLLQVEGRMSYRELGQRVGLTAPAVTERVRKLEEQGVIKGYRAVVDYEALGFPLLCVIRLNSPRGAQGVDEIIKAIPEVIEANRVTGSESHVIRARLRSTAHLEELLDRLWAYGDSVTNIVTSSPVPRRPMRLRSVLKRAR
jgi:Lrp/AsnC family leucine-responsive transcriptional regulator